jgi:hypothetical protein
MCCGFRVFRAFRGQIAVFNFILPTVRVIVFHSLIVMNLRINLQNQQAVTGV